jgi:hypothetical protein
VLARSAQLVDVVADPERVPFDGGEHVLVQDDLVARDAAEAREADAEVAVATVGEGHDLAAHHVVLVHELTHERQEPVAVGTSGTEGARRWRRRWRSSRAGPAAWISRGRRGRHGG